MVSSTKVTYIVLLEFPKFPEFLLVANNIGSITLGELPIEGGSYNRRREYIPFSRLDKVIRR